MNIIPETLQDTIYQYKHQLEFKHVVKELNEIIDYWCDEELTFRYCKIRHEPILNKCKNEFQCLNDYEEHLFISLVSKHILDILNDKFNIFDYK